MVIQVKVWVYESRKWWWSKLDVRREYWTQRRSSGLWKLGDRRLVCLSGEVDLLKVQLRVKRIPIRRLSLIVLLLNSAHWMDGIATYLWNLMWPFPRSKLYDLVIWLSSMNRIMICSEQSKCSVSRRTSLLTLARAADRSLKIRFMMSFVSPKLCIYILVNFETSFYKTTLLIGSWNDPYHCRRASFDAAVCRSCGRGLGAWQNFQP